MSRFAPLRANIHAAFEARAERYRRLDEQHAHQTRFFAAAAATNGVLADLCVHRARWLWISPANLDGLNCLGRQLEAINVDRARHLGREDRSPGCVDAAFVEMEQTVVEFILRGWAHNCTPRYPRLTFELDRLLRTATAGLFAFCTSANLDAYTRVLRCVTATTGRFPSFALCADRMKIGKALIADIRQVARRPHLG